MSTVALGKQYAFVQVDDAMLVHDLVEYKDNKVIREPLAVVARFVEENMYAMNISKPDPYSVPIMYIYYKCAKPRCPAWVSFGPGSCGD